MELKSRETGLKNNSNKLNINVINIVLNSLSDDKTKTLKLVDHLKNSFLHPMILKSYNKKVLYEGYKDLIDLNILLKLKPYLKRLNLAQKNLTEENINILYNIPQVQDLDISNNSRIIQSIERFTKINLSNIQKLNLSHNLIEVEASKHISQCNFINLTMLDLSINDLEDEAMKYISNGKYTNLLSLLTWEFNFKSRNGIFSNWKINKTYRVKL